jgi:O-antigen biosynthesis protein
MGLYSSLRMSWYELAFEEYKKSRNKVYPTRLSGLQCPVEPGLVSIVLPVYNGAGMLTESIDSILAQTYQNFELICINDGSKDDSGAILDSYAARDSRIHVIHQENRKLPRSLSRGFEQARGEFRTWTSHDNRMKPFFLQKLVDCLLRHPNWDMVYANIDIIDEDGNLMTGSDWYKGIQRPPGSGHVFLPHNTGRLNTLPDNYIGSAFMYRDRASYLIGDYASSRFTLEDYDYWMQVNSLLHLRHTDFEEPIYDYRFHSKSLTAQDQELGITRSRGKLFAFESFRRDFYLSPLVWIVEGSDQNPPAAAQINQIIEQVKINGDLLLRRGQYSAEQLPRLWMPCLYLYAAASLEDLPPPPADLPRSAVKALLAFSNGELPASVPHGWDLCINWGSAPNPPALDGHYQGWLQAADLQTILTALDIRARTDHVRQIEEEIASSGARENKVSVIIATYRRPENLINALKSMANQTLGLDHYEVVVVNNDPSDAKTNQLVAEAREMYYCEKPEKLRLVYCPIPGLSAARNAGISESRGRVIAFIDDDAVASENWLEQAWNAFQDHPSTGVLGGTILLQPPEPRPAALKPGWEGLWTHFIPDYKDYRTVKYWYEYPWGTNWLAPRDLLLEIGGFRSQYGRRMRDFGGGEEVVAAGSIHSLGKDVGIEPSALVYHRPSADRYTDEHVWKTNIQGALVSYRAQRHLYIPFSYTVPSNIRQIIRVALMVLDNLLPWKWNPNMALFYLLKILGRIVLLKQQVADYFYRFRKPVILQEP